MPAERILDGDTLKVGKDKLNKAIEQANKSEVESADAVVTSGNAVDIANAAKASADSTRTELDAVVVRETDSDAMSRQAAVDADGVDQLNLKTRLDKDYNETAVKLADKASKSALPIYLSDYGVSHTETAAVNTPLFKQAIADAEAEGRPIILPWVPDGLFIDVNEKLNIAVGGIKIQGYGKQTRIRQTLFPNQIFHVLAPKVVIDSFAGFGVDFTAAGMGDQHVTYAAVYVQASDVKVNNIYGDNLSTVVNVAGVTGLLDNVEVTNIDSSDNIVFNLLVSGTRGFKFRNIRGSYRFMTGVATPPHLIYFSQAYGNNYDVNGSDFYSENGTGSYAYQFRGVIGGLISGLIAHNNYGLLNIMESQDLTVKGLLSTGDKYDNETTASLELQGTNDRIKIEDVLIKMDANGKPIRIAAGASNSSIKKAEVVSNHTVKNVANSYDVDIQGTNNTADDIEVTNIGIVPWDAGVGIWSGNKNTINDPKSKGNANGAIIRTGDSNKIKNFLPSNLEATDGKPLIIGVEATQAGVFPISSKSNGIDKSDRLIAFDRGGQSLNSQGIIFTTTSGHVWTQVYGQWRSNGERIYADLGSGALMDITLNTPNIEISAGIKYANREALAIRVIDRLNYIGAKIDHTLNLAYIYSSVAGVNTRLAEVAFTPQIGRRYHHKLIVFGNVAEYYIDDVKLLTVTLSESLMTTFGSSSKHGLVSLANVNGLFDNIEWRNIE